MSRAEAGRVSPRWIKEILATLYRLHKATRAEIAGRSSLNNASVSRGLQQLTDAGVIRKLGEIDSGGGRPREVLALEPDAAAFVAIDLEGATVQFARTSLTGEIIRRSEAAVPLGGVLPLESLFGGIAGVTRGLPQKGPGAPLAIGISFPGLLDQNGLLTALNLGWHDVPLKRLLQERCKTPVFLERDEQTCIRAERQYGCARDSRNWIYLLASNGIGVGLVVDGHHVSGHTQMAGELGHIVVDPSSTALCGCGKRGCLETVASTAAILRQYADGSRKRPASLAEVFDCARAGDPIALAVTERAARAIGLALSHAVNLLNPELLVIGGDIAAGQDLLVPVLQEELNRHALPQLAGSVKIVTSELGPDIRLRGAASLAFHACLGDPKLLAKVCRMDSGRAFLH